MATRELISLLDRWKPKRIVVAGDFMLDRYAYGNAERLSPDAPVPVLAIVREEAKAGGAANVCLDLRALQCDVATLSVVGDDAAGLEMREALEEAGCDTQGLVIDSNRPTTVKHNFVGLAQHRHPQKMFRVDTEDKSPMSEEAIKQLLDMADQLLVGADMLCLEDYNKGVLSRAACQGLIERAKRRGVPVLVDPAAIDDYSKYRGATCITPNRTEAERATHRQDVGNDLEALTAMARSLKQQCALDTIVLTLDKAGALLLEADDQPQLVPTVARQVYDVTGAGDMVLAMLAAARANGADWRQSVALANTAAGLEVEKFGVVPITLEEVLLSLLQNDHASGKLRRLEHLLPELAAHRKQGKRIAFTNGCFDILHAGHVQYLRHAARHGDLLIVGVNSDDSIRRLKGPQRPVNQLDDRVLVLSELESVDYVVVFDDDTPMDLIETIRPDALVKGADYTREQVVGHEVVESYGGEVVLVPLVEGRSTTNIIEKVKG
ncbi:D-glycero-beta-D-manno-heptose 1-phosphate adenylyltransferase [Phycisphaerales bacterium AB-hyl4]|uniref:Bifunctional protein HldE n=1 Tax=Natronomicrosphaera hydrolytica TaxID=3242702 RepID=A0ABV4U2S0_9BACT